MVVLVSTYFYAGNTWRICQYRNRGYLGCFNIIFFDNNSEDAGWEQIVLLRPSLSPKILFKNSETSNGWREVEEV